MLKLPENYLMNTITQTEVRFVTAVTAGGSVKFMPGGVNFSIFTHLFVLLSPKLFKFFEIKGVKFFAWKSGGVILLTNLMSMPIYAIIPKYSPKRNFIKNLWNAVMQFCCCEETLVIFALILRPSAKLIDQTASQFNSYLISVHREAKFVKIFLQRLEKGNE